MKRTRSEIPESKLSKFYQMVLHNADLWSKDPVSHVCALVVDPEDLQILSTGYNGIPRGVKETSDRWSRENNEKLFWVEHAERNAIFNASLNGTKLKGATLICNKFPCADCARAIIQCGISHVASPAPTTNPRWKKSWDVSQQMFKEANVRVSVL